MNLNQLATFRRVVETKNFTRAAEALHLTQPAVTQQIQALEDELGERLFDRMGRSVYVTQAGQILNEYAARILDLFAECRTAMADLKGLTRGRIAIGAGLTLSIFMLPEILRPYRSEHPEIEIAVSTGTTRQVMELVLANTVDVGLVTGPTSHPDLVIATLYEDEMVLMVYPEHPFARKGQIVPEELNDAPLIFFESGSGYRAFLEQVFQQNGISPRVHMELDSIEAMKRMAEVGLGITIIPAMSAREEVASGSLIPVAIKSIGPLKRSTTLVYRRDKYISSSMSAFFAILEKHYGVKIKGKE